MVERLSAEESGSGINVHVLGTDEPENSWTGAKTGVAPLRGPRVLGYPPKMRSLLRYLRPSVVHIHGLWQLFGVVVNSYCQSNKVPYVVSPHGMMVEGAVNQKPFRKSFARKLYQNRIIEQAACLVATSELEYHDLRRLGIQGPIAIVPLGIDEAEPVPHFEQNNIKQVVYLGRKAPLKGLDRLLEAWNSLSSDYPDWALNIVGPDDRGYEAQLARLIETNTIPRVRLSDQVKGEALETAYKSGQIFAHPSLCDNFAITVGESLMRGVPVIATNKTPWTGIEENDCGRFIEGSVQSIETALREMMDLSAERRFEMGRRGRAWMMRDFRWPRAAKMHHEIYSWILGDSEMPGFVFAK